MKYIFIAVDRILFIPVMAWAILFTVLLLTFGDLLYMVWHLKKHKSPDWVELKNDSREFVADIFKVGLSECIIEGIKEYRDETKSN